MSATIGSLNILPDFIAIQFVIRFRFDIYYNIERRSTLIGLFFIFFVITSSVPLKVPSPLLHMYVTLLSVMIIVPVVVLGYYCRTEDTHITRTHTRTHTRFPVLLDVYVDVMTSVTVRVEGIVRVHIYRYVTFLYIYIYLYISLPPSL